MIISASIQIEDQYDFLSQNEKELLATLDIKRKITTKIYPLIRIKMIGDNLYESKNIFLTNEQAIEIKEIFNELNINGMEHITKKLKKILMD